MIRDVLDLDEIRQEIGSLTGADLVRLRKSGNIFALGLNIAADDLIGEAVVSALNGSRKCPRTVKVVTFLIGAMRSMASAKRESSRRKAQPVSLDATGTDGLAVVEIACPEPHAEELSLRAEDVELRIAALQDLFADDDEALLFLWADLEEISKEDIMEMNKLDLTAYATIRRRMRRAIDRKFPDGWTA